jgi:hypothetical protein
MLIKYASITPTEDSCPYVETYSFFSNAGIMIGEGASASDGISKSTVAEWEQQVSADWPHFLFFFSDFNVVVLN